MRFDSSSKETVSAVEHDVAPAEQVHLNLLRALAQALAYVGLQILHERL